MSETSQNDGKMAKPTRDNGGKIPNFSSRLGCWVILINGCSGTNQELIPVFGAPVVCLCAGFGPKVLPVGIWWTRGVRGAYPGI